MSIQAKINQTLSLASMLITMNPSVRAAAEKRNEIKNVKKHLEGVKVQEEALKSLPPETARFQKSQDLTKTREQLSQKLFELDPNEETAKSAIEAISASNDSAKNKPEEMANRAQRSIQVAQEEKRRGRPRRDFIKSIGGEMTNLGLPVSALAKTPEQKAAIRGAYTKQEKTKIMNEMEEKKSGK